MQYIDKDEKLMDAKERLRLELMRTMAAAKGWDLREGTVDFDFRTGTNAFKMADGILKRFDVEFKDEKEAKIFWARKDVHWKGKDGEEQQAPALPFSQTKPQTPQSQPQAKKSGPAAMPDDPLGDVGLNGTPTPVEGTDSGKGKGKKKSE